MDIEEFEDDLTNMVCGPKTDNPNAHLDAATQLLFNTNNVGPWFYNLLDVPGGGVRRRLTKAAEDVGIFTTRRCK